MNIDRAELANAIAEATGWSVSADTHRGLRRRRRGPASRLRHRTPSVLMRSLRREYQAGAWHQRPESLRMGGVTDRLE